VLLLAEQRENIQGGALVLPSVGCGKYFLTLDIVYIGSVRMGLVAFGVFGNGYVG